ncbi:hypothetical protein [Pseudomonas fluorescens]|jgi:diaminopimelate epimerase|uniref:Diaminopimelate epimerase n=1 Tax=Pseudomonas fluorescens TaxID=294 RepID=A0A5E7LK24_PSEFL|nr:hypothetical protein PS854_03453 [Pseudomonas fluorescens]
MSLSFHKMHANGDDFVIVDSRNAGNSMTADIARRMGDRNRGVGFGEGFRSVQARAVVARL